MLHLVERNATVWGCRASLLQAVAVVKQLSTCYRPVIKQASAARKLSVVLTLVSVSLCFTTVLRPSRRSKLGVV